MAGGIYPTLKSFPRRLIFLLGTADRLAPKWPRIDGIRAVLTIANLIPQSQTYLAEN